MLYIFFLCEYLNGFKNFAIATELKLLNMSRFIKVDSFHVETKFAKYLPCLAE